MTLLLQSHSANAFVKHWISVTIYQMVKEKHKTTKPYQVHSFGLGKGACVKSCLLMLNIIIELEYRRLNNSLQTYDLVAGFS